MGSSIFLLVGCAKQLERVGSLSGSAGLGVVTALVVLHKVLGPEKFLISSAFEIDLMDIVLF